MVKKSNTADIITTVLHTVLNTENNLQSNKDLKPINWCKNLSELEIQQKMKNFIEKCKCDFRVYRFRYLQQLLKKLLEETESEVEDCIDVIRKENYRFCTNPECGERYLNLKRKYDICEWKVVKNLNETNVFRDIYWE